MRGFRQVVAVFLGLCALAAPAFGQYSASNYGQNASGGMGGGGNRFVGLLNGVRPQNDYLTNRAQMKAEAFRQMRDSAKDRPDDETNQGLWQEKAATLGDRYDLKFELKKGETLLASARSDAFAPALRISTASGTALMTNNGRSDEDQTPFVSFRAPEAGTYFLTVLNLRSSGGGAFVVRYRRFISLPLAVGKNRFTELSPQTGPFGQRLVLHVSAKKGVTYDLFGTRSNRSVSFEGTITGPTGVAKNDFEKLTDPSGACVFRAKTEGDFYIDDNFYGGDRRSQEFVEQELHEVTYVDAKEDGDLKLDFGPTELKIVRMAVRKDQVVRTSLSQNNWVNGNFAAPDALGEAWTPIDLNLEQPVQTGVDSFWLRPNLDHPRDVIHVFQEDGYALWALRSFNGQPESGSFSASTKIPEWNQAEPISSDLKIGCSEIRILRAKPSEIMKVYASAKGFVPQLQIFYPSGQLANTLSNRKNRNCADDLYFPEAGFFIVRFSCLADSGSGSFEMKRDTPSAEAFTLGSDKRFEFTGQNFGLYEVLLEAGKRYEFLADQYVQVDLIDDEGQFLQSQRISFDGVVVDYFTPNKTGKHRLWLRSIPTTVHFKLGRNVPPKIGP